MTEPGYYVHPTAVVDEGATIGAGSKVWHFAHVMGQARIGENTVVGQGCYIANVVIGNGVRWAAPVKVTERASCGCASRVSRPPCRTVRSTLLRFWRMSSR